MKINITREIIDRSNYLLKKEKKLRIHCCPIALAASEALGRKVNVFIGGIHDDVTEDKVAVLSPQAALFMDLFDDNREVEPTEVEIYVV